MTSTRPPIDTFWPTGFLCEGHVHPLILRPISWGQLAEELDGFARAADLHVQLRWWKPLDRAHRRSHRRYAQVIAEACIFEFSRAILWLPKKYRLGLMAHEIGHCLAPLEGEAGADRAAEEVFGVRLRYDSEHWPGKGLQCIDRGVH